MRTTPRVILILKQASSAARLHKTLAQKLVLTEPIQREMDDVISILDDRLQKAKVVAVFNKVVPRVEMAVRSNQYGLPRSPESLIEKIQLGDLLVETRNSSFGCID